MYQNCMIVKGNISTFSNGYTILLHATHFCEFHRTQKITCLRPFLPSSTGAQYSYRDHTSHVFLGTQKITCMRPWTAEHKKINFVAAICDKFKNHYIVDCNILNIKSNSKTTYQVKIYILGIMVPIFS
jgi:hypothetical protein